MTLREIGDRLESLAKLAQAVTGSLELPEVLDRVARASTELLPDSSSRIWVVEGDRLVVRAETGTLGPPGSGWKTEFAFGEGMTGHVAVTQEPLVVEDVSVDPRVVNVEWMRQEGYVSFVGIPLVVRDRLVGVLALLTRHRHRFSPEEVEILVSFGAHTAIAIENARLYAEVQQRLRQTETLLAVSQAVASTLELTEVLRRATREAVWALGADVGSAWRLSPSRDQLVPIAGYHVPKNLDPSSFAPPVLRGHPLVEEVRRLEGSIYSTDSQADPRFDYPLLQLLPHKSVLVHPMRLKGDIIGVFVIVWVREAHSFTPEELRLTEGIARQAVLAIENSRLYEEGQARVARLERLTELSHLVASSLDSREVLDLVAEAALDLLKGDLARIWVVDEAAGVLKLGGLKSRHRGSEPVASRTQFRLGEGLVGWVVAQKTKRYSPNLLEDPLQVNKEWVRAGGYVSQIAVPMVAGGQALGALVVVTRAPRQFSGEEEELLELFAANAATALENARLYAETKRRRREAEVLAELVRTINTSLDLDTILQRVAEGAKGICGSDMAGIALRDPRSDAMVIRYRIGVRYQGYDTLRVEPEKGAGGLVLATGRPFRTDNYAEDPRISKDYLEVAREEEIVTELVVPIQIEDRVEGLLYVDNRSPRPFTDQDQAILVRLADHAAIAIQNARLFEEQVRLFEETRRQHQEAVAFGEVARDITSSLDLHEVFQRIVDRARDLCGGDLAFLAPYDREKGTATIGAVSGARTRVLMSLTIMPGRGTGGRVLETGEPFVTDDYLHDPRISQDYAAAAIREGFIAQAVVPLLFRGAITGLLWVVNRTPRRFTPRDIAILNKLADQAAIALENARLYVEAREQLKETEKLLSVTRALSSTLELEPLFRHFLRQVAQILDADSTGVWLVNPDTGLLEAFAGYHIPPHLLELLRAARLSPEETPFYADGIRGKRLQVSSNVPEDPRIPASYKALMPHRSQLFAPIVVKDDVIGAIMAVWWERPREFSERELALVEAMGSQAGVAIENAHLFQKNQRKVEEQAVLYELSRAVTGQLDVAQLVQAIRQQVGRVLDARNMVVLLYDEERREFEVALRMLDGEPDSNPTYRYSLGRGLVSRVVERRQAIRTADYAETCRQEGVEAVETSLRFPYWLGVPMIAGDQTVGGLLLRSGAHPFTEADQRLLTNIAGLAALAVRSARLYEERAQAYHELAAAQDQLIRTEKLRALGEMASGVAHNFNNLLTSILGRTQLILQHVEDSRLRQWLQVIERTALDGARTVRRIQEFTRIRRDRPFEAVDLNEVVQEVLEITQPRWREEAQSKGVSVQVVTSLVPLPPVAGDAAELREVLVNLVLNAVDAMPGGGTLSLTTEVTGERVVVTVSDTGVGMSKEIQRRLFDPFFTTKGQRGTGLGLSMTYGIVSRHGGEIAVETAEGKGSTFRVSFWTGHAAPAGPRPAPSPAVVPLRCLVVDDEEPVRDVLGDLLKVGGHAVVLLGDGAEAIARFRAEPFDLVITDLAMPGLNGWEVARAVKEQDPAVPVFMVTGWGVEYSPEDLKGRGVDRVLSKPLNFNEVLSAVAACRPRGSPQGGLS